MDWIYTVLLKSTHGTFTHSHTHSITHWLQSLPCQLLSCSPGATHHFLLKVPPDDSMITHSHTHSCSVSRPKTLQCVDRRPPGLKPLTFSLVHSTSWATAAPHSYLQGYDLALISTLNLLHLSLDSYSAVLSTALIGKAMRVLCVA